LAGATSYGDVVLSQTETFNFSPNGSEALVFNMIDGTVSDFSDIVSIDVTITLNKIGGSYSVDNDSISSGSVTLEHELDGALVQGSGPSFIRVGDFSTAWATTDLSVLSTTNTTLQGTTGDATDAFNNTGDVDFFQFNPADDSTVASASINSAVWSGYFSAGGPDTFTWNIDVSQLVDVQGLGGVNQSFVVSQATGSVQVNYTLIPEPGTLALAGIMLGSFGGLHLLRRRKKA
jgi:hypothetical protein